MVFKNLCILVLWTKVASCWKGFDSLQEKEVVNSLASTVFLHLTTQIELSKSFQMNSNMTGFPGLDDYLM